MFQRIPVSIFHGNQGLPQVAYNNTSIYSPSFADIGSTLTAPMQFRQHASNNPILSALLIFQLSEAMFNSQPSGMSPSKNGKRRLSVYGMNVTGIVKVMNFSG